MKMAGSGPVLAMLEAGVERPRIYAALIARGLYIITAASGKVTLHPANVATPAKPKPKRAA